MGNSFPQYLPCSSPLLLSSCNWPPTQTEYRANVDPQSDAEPFLWTWFSFFPVHIQAIQMQQQEVLVTFQFSGYINHCMHKRKPVVRTAHITFPWALHWGRLMCTLPDSASPGERDSWSCYSLCYVIAWALGLWEVLKLWWRQWDLGGSSIPLTTRQWDKVWRGASQLLWSVCAAAKVVAGGSSSHPGSDLHLVTIWLLKHSPSSTAFSTQLHPVPASLNLISPAPCPWHWQSNCNLQSTEGTV